MNYKPKYTFLLLVYCLLVNLSMHSQSNIEQVQVIPGELPDPSIIEVEGVYYATGTSGDWAPIYPIYKSSDLKNWQLMGHVFQNPPDWTMSSFWAPELFYKDGTFYCYYTARAKDGISKIGVATTKDISKGFEDKGVIIEWGNEAIDAFVFHHKDTLYITWKAYGLEPSKPVTLLGSQLANDGLTLVGEEFVTLTADDNEFEDNMIEGQCIFEKDGYLYMVYSGNGCCGDQCNYQVGVARSQSMEGPWEKAPSNPLIVGNSSWKCPGHGTVINTNDNWYYLYHAYNTKGFPSLGRAAIFSDMYWDEDSEWPYFKVSEETTDRGSLEKNSTDNFDKSTLNKFWRRNMRASDFGVELANGTLKLTEIEPEPENKTGSVLCVIPDNSDFEFSVEVKNQNQALKGLVLYTGRNKNLGLGVKGQNLIHWKIVDGDYQEITSIPLTDVKNLGLKATVKNASTFAFQYRAANDGWKAISGAEDGNLVGLSSEMKVGLQIKKDNVSGDDEGVFDDFSIQY